MKPFISTISVGRTKFALYGLLLIGMYYSTYSWLITEDWSRADYSASYLIPFIFVYLLWEKRDTIVQLPSCPTWSGLWILSWGIALFWIGELSGEYFSLYLSSWLIFVGILWIHMGWQKLKTFGFPLIILLAMFPLPHFIYGKLSFQLKLISSRLGVWAMQALGMSAYREGNLIDLGFTQLQVVDACSGLRYLIPLMVLGLLFAYFFKGALWKKMVLILSAVPIAIAVNGMRVASVGILYQYFGRTVAEGFFHDFSGWLIFMVSFVLLLGMTAFLKLIGGAYSAEGDRSDTDASEVPGATRNGPVTEAPCSKLTNESHPETDDRFRIPHQGSSIQHPESDIQSPAWRNWLTPPQSLAIILMLGLTLICAQGVEFRQRVPIHKPLAEFPRTIGPWHGQTKTLEQKFIDELDFSDYIIIDFMDRRNRSVNLYVAYYDHQQKGESIHSPATCLPGHGWQFTEAGATVVQSARSDMPQMTVRRAHLQNGDARLLSYFWFPMRGRILINAYQMKMYNMWDALTIRQTHGALVRLITPVYDDETMGDADQRLRSFSKVIVPTLAEFLP